MPLKCRTNISKSIPKSLIDPSFKGVKGLFIINLQPHREKKGESGTPDQPNL